MSNRFLLIPLLLATSVVAASCGESAGCWNDIKGRYTSCTDMRADEIDQRLDQRDKER